jgi:hypothetical protein
MLALSLPASAQNSLDLTVDGVGLSIGDSREITGIRLNFRDRAMRSVTGINATIWMPYKDHGGDVRGLALGFAAGGLGVGAGRDVRGVAFGGLGAGAGRDLKGIVVSGLGAGAGRDIKGIALGGIAAGGRDVYALSLAPAYFTIEPGGEMRGLSISAFNRIRGEQKGITIGILNYARKLSGFQFGLINIAQNKSRFKIMPFVNHAR